MRFLRPAALYKCCPIKLIWGRMILEGEEITVTRQTLLGFGGGPKD